jgi:hypothetical protein
MEELNADKHELTIDQLDAASGGALYQPLIVVAIVTAVAIRTAIESLVHKIAH